MVRSSWKNIFIDSTIYRYLGKPEKSDLICTTRSRNTKVTKDLLNSLSSFKGLVVYNGRTDEKIKLLDQSDRFLDSKLGEFIFTKKRTQSIHNKKKENKGFKDKRLIAMGLRAVRRRAARREEKVNRYKPKKYKKKRRRMRIVRKN